MVTETSAAAAFQSLGVCAQLAESAAALGWKKPTAVQEQAVPLLLQGLTPPHIDSDLPVEPHRVTQPWALTLALEQFPRGLSIRAVRTAGKDVIGLAQTGSGKTGAFALPILQDLLEKQTKNFALVLSPTRELAIQVLALPVRNLLATLSRCQLASLSSNADQYRWDPGCSVVGSTRPLSKRACDRRMALQAYTTQPDSCCEHRA